MIYNEGSIVVTGGSYIVEGVGTSWRSRGVRAGMTLTLPYIVGVMQVSRVLNDNILHLTGFVPNLSEGERINYDTYALASDFTPNLAIPYPNEGEADNSVLLRRSGEFLDRLVPRP